MSDILNDRIVPLSGWTVPRPVFRRIEDVTPPYGSVIGLSSAKKHLRITDTASDDYVTMLIDVSVSIVEQYLTRKLLTRTVRMWMDFIPGTGREYSYQDGSSQIPVRYANLGMYRWFELYGTPCKEFISFKYITNNGVELVWDPQNYIIDLTDKDQPARVILQRGCVWPIDLQVAHSIALEYKLGYGVEADIPIQIRHGILLVLAALWSNRGDNADQPLDILSFPGIKSILDPFRVMKIST